MILVMQGTRVQERHLPFLGRTEELHVSRPAQDSGSVLVQLNATVKPGAKHLA